MHGAVGVGEGTCLLAPRGGRQHYVGEFGSFGEENVLHHEEEPVLREDVADPRQFGHRHRGIRRGHPQHLQRALFGVPEHLHGVRRRAVMRNLLLLDIPQLREVGDMTIVGPVPKPGQVAVGAAFAGVLRGGLTVHLQHTASRLTEHAANQVNVVDLQRCCGGLVRLVKALQNRRQQAFGGADQMGCTPNLLSVDTADGSSAFRRVSLRHDSVVRRILLCARRCNRGRSSRAR